MKKYIKLMRIPHYVKNGLIFLPLIFGKALFNGELFFKTIMGFISFSLMASVIYIINDINDAEADRQHPVKCRRPIASGEVGVRAASVLAAALFTASCGVCFFGIGGSKVVLYPLVYFVINLAYSIKLKHIPIIDISVLVAGFLIRVYFGAAITGIAVSSWLYLTVMTMAFYLGVGKRRNELIKDSARKVLKEYTQNFLDKSMYMFMSLAIVFYSLWCMDIAAVYAEKSELLFLSVPLIIIICLKYSLNVEKSSYADPVEVVFGDKTLMALIGIYGIFMMYLLYFI